MVVAVIATSKRHMKSFIVVEKGVGGVETGKVLASCRMMIKQAADALLESSSNQRTESYILLCMSRG